MSQFKESAFGDKIKKWWAGRHDRRAQRKLNREGRKAQWQQKYNKKNTDYVTQPAAQAAKPAPGTTEATTDAAAQAAKPADTVSYKKSGTDFQQQAKKTDAATGQTTALADKTKGGDYKVYGKQSQKAQDYRTAFKDARTAGKKSFTWNGQEHAVKMASFIEFNKQAGFQDELVKLGGLGGLIMKGLTRGGRALKRGAKYLWGASPKSVHKSVTKVIKKNPIASTAAAGIVGADIAGSENTNKQHQRESAAGRQGYEQGISDALKAQDMGDRILTAKQKQAMGIPSKLTVMEPAEQAARMAEAAKLRTR